MTSYGEEFDDLSQQIDHIKITTERIVTNVQAMVQPHPGIRTIVCTSAFIYYSVVQVLDWRLGSTLS